MTQHDYDAEVGNADKLISYEQLDDDDEDTQVEDECEARAYDTQTHA